MGETMSPMPSALGSVYFDFKAHCSAPRNEPGVAIIESIRMNNQQAHITPVSVNECDIVSYGAAGHAFVSLVWEGDNWFGRRTYSAPKTRLEKGRGRLGESIRFGLYLLNFQGTVYHFYVAKWQDPFQPSQHHSFILSPRDDVDEDGHSAAVDDMILTIGKWTSELHNEIYVFDDGQWTKSAKLWEAVQAANWDDVIIDPTMKKTLVSDVHSFFDSQQLFQDYAVPWKRGIIMHGTPGCGKTISIKALMNSLDKRETPVASLYVKSFDCCAGEQYSIREIFIRARAMAPCLLIFEDLDSLVKDKVRSYFLNEVDGLENNDGVLMIGSTNHLERLDPGISKRPSRFDRKYFYRLPDEAQRVMYCEYWKKKLERNSDVNFNPEICHIVAKMTEGFSFAYLKELFVQTLLALATGRLDNVDETETGKAGMEAIDADGNSQRLNKVEVPEHLKENELLHILRKQLVSLWKDMDTSSDPENKAKEAGASGENADGEEEQSLQSAEYMEQMRRIRRANAQRLSAEDSD